MAIKKFWAKWKLINLTEQISKVKMNSFVPESKQIFFRFTWRLGEYFIVMIYIFSLLVRILSLLFIYLGDPRVTRNILCMLWAWIGMVKTAQYLKREKKILLKYIFKKKKICIMQTLNLLKIVIILVSWISENALLLLYIDFL